MREPPIDTDRELSLLVDALYAAETGAPLDVGELPYYTACWFLDHAPRLRRTVAYAAFRLMQQIARAGDDELCARVATALLPFVDLYAEKVEELLLEILERAPMAAGAAAVETLIALFSVEDVASLVERWTVRSPAARQAIVRAQMLLAMPGGALAVETAH